MKPSMKWVCHASFYIITMLSTCTYAEVGSTSAVENVVQNEASESDRYFTSSDGVKIHYRVEGQGDPLVIFPGYGQSADTFDGVYERLKEEFTVYTIDYRWLGKSDSPAYGSHISRFAMDAKEMTAHAQLDRFYLFAHSMGNTVAWSYFSLFGQQQVIKYILGDEAPCLITDPAWTEEEKEKFTGSKTDKDLWTAWRSPEITGERQESALITRMQNKLLVEHLGNDWRDILPTIQVPTLILMGGRSHFSSPALWEYMHNSIENSQLAVIEEGGHGYYQSHPDEFASVLKQFFKKSQ